MPLTNDVLSQLLERLKEEGTFVLASPKDADFFRRAYSAPKPLLIPKPVPIQAPSPQKEPAPPQPLKVELVVDPTPLKKKPLQRKAPSDFSTLRNVLSIVSSELSIINEIPNDEIAVKISERWKTKNQSAPISILIFQEQPEQRAFLEQIASAVDIYYGPAKIVHAEKIEKDKQWGAFLSVADLKMIIVCDYTLWQLNQLMEHYKEVPANGTRVLGKIPLFLLPDLSLYLKDSLLKRSLWNALRQKCQLS